MVPPHLREFLFRSAWTITLFAEPGCLVECTLLRDIQALTCSLERLFIFFPLSSNFTVTLGGFQGVRCLCDDSVLIFIGLFIHLFWLAGGAGHSLCRRQATFVESPSAAARRPALAQIQQGEVSDLFLGRVNFIDAISLSNQNVIYLFSQNKQQAVHKAAADTSSAFLLSFTVA